MRFLTSSGFSDITTALVCLLEVIYTLGLQTAPFSEAITTQRSILSNLSYTTSYHITRLISGTENLQNITDIISKLPSNITDNLISTNGTKKRSKKVRRRRRKRKRKEVKFFNQTVTMQRTEIQIETTTTGAKRKRKRKIRRRKNRKYRTKHLLQNKENTNILELTTARGVVFSTDTNSNSTINELIRKLNENPEDSFENFKQKHVTSTNFSKPNLQRVGNLVSPILSSDRHPVILNDNITIIVDINNGTNTKIQRSKFNRCRKHKGGCTHFCNPRGKIKCFCLPGFTLAKDKRTCLDIDECKINNGGCESKCINTLSSFECRCPTGLRLSENLKTCEDINECLLRNGHGPCQDTCENTYGSYKCSCKALNGTQLGHDGHLCVDLDECANNNGGCSHGCINTLGRAFCTCPDGMLLSSDWKTCQDINECEDNATKEICQYGCVNTEGSFQCVEVAELQSDQSITNIACGPLFPPRRGFISCSRNAALYPYTRTGRKRVTNSPGTICKLECPIGYKIVGEFNVSCGFYGEWEGKREAKCIRAAPPILQCPTTQHFSIKNNSKMVDVAFPSPKTNVKWKYVKSYPSWAKNLKGSIIKGNHEINFTVRDPATKLSSSCSFKIVIK